MEINRYKGRIKRFLPKYLAINKVVKRKIANIGIYAYLYIQQIAYLSFKFYIFQYNYLIFSALSQ